MKRKHGSPRAGFDRPAGIPRVPLSTRIPEPQLEQLEQLVDVHRGLRDPAMQRGRVSRGDVVAAALVVFAGLDPAARELALSQVRGE